MSILVVAAHPDDEVLGCGGTLLTFVNEHIAVLFLTDGVSSRKGCTSKDIHNRVNLANRVADETEWVNYHTESMWGKDNQMDTVPLLRVVKSVEYIIGEVKPKIIFTHYEHDLNIDHRITYQAVVTACRPFKFPHVRGIYSFEIPSSTELSSIPFKPDTFVNITHTIDRKGKLFDIYNEDSPARNVASMRSLYSLRGNQSGCGYAEAFKTIRRSGV